MTTDAGLPNEGDAQQAPTPVQKTLSWHVEPLSIPCSTSTLSRRQIGMIMAALCTNGFIASLDAVIVGIALPVISSDLHSTSIEIAWIGASYLLSSAAFLPLWASVSDRLGRKPVMAGGMMCFLVGCILGALSRRTDMLIAGRVVQGMGGGAMISMSNICLADLFSLRERGLYIAMIAAASCFGVALAPILGGVLVRYAGWPWIFWVNVPFVCVSLVLFLTCLNTGQSLLDVGVGLRNVDWIGALLIACGTVLALVGLQLGNVLAPWSSGLVIGLLVGGTVAVIAFVVRETCCAFPVIPPSIFRSLSSTLCMVICFSHGLSYIGMLYFGPIYLILVLQASVLQAGTWLLLLAITMSIVTVAAAVLIRSTGTYRPIIWISSTSLTLGLGLAISFPSERNWPKLIIVQLLLALGAGPLFQAPFLAMQAWVTPAEISRANGAYVFLRTISSSISIVLGQVVLQNGLHRQLLDGVHNRIIPPELAASFSRQLSSLYDISALPALQQSFVRQTLASSLSHVWIMYTVFASVGLLAGVFLEHRPLSKERAISVTSI